MYTRNIRKSIALIGIKNVKRQLKKSLLKEIKARYKRKQLIINIQEQLQELSIIVEKTMNVEAHVFAKRVRVINTLFVFITLSSEEECKQ